MMDYKLYPNLPPLAPPENPQVAYQLSVRLRCKGRKIKSRCLSKNTRNTLK